MSKPAAGVEVVHGSPAGAAGSHDAPVSGVRLGVMVGALGVVYGDIGTSPLYTLKECLSPSHGIGPAPGNILGILSMILWSLILVVTVKYVVFVMRADNRGEGGILALLALTRSLPDTSRRRRRLMVIGLLGASLFYGDSLITPAISVLGAVEGLGVDEPAFQRLVVPLSLGILIGVFVVQRHGTERVGAFFGPVMVLWFVTLGALGLAAIVRSPQVLAAVNPYHAVSFFFTHDWIAFLVLGSVVLAVTGGEALYADMGHFGRDSIRAAWLVVVLPSLVLNYFGQGALLLTEPEAVENPFYHLAPDWLHYPLVVLATVAAVIACQAVITGAYSLTQQAIQLGYLPRLSILHTSATTRGQIYMPAVNWTLLVGVVLLVLGFESSSRLAAAYGIAVTGTMVATTLLVYVVARRIWRWPAWKTLTVIGLFFLIDGAFFLANLAKVPDGGWVPLVIGFAIFTLMTTWRGGRRLVAVRGHAGDLRIDRFVERLPQSSLPRVRGTAIYLSGLLSTLPRALLHNIKHNKVLHERVVIMTVIIEDRPRVPPHERATVETLDHGFVRVFLRYGFMEEPNIPSCETALGMLGLELDCMRTSFFIGRDTVVPSMRPGMSLWRERLFAVMTRNATSPTDFFHIPTNRVVELGSQVEI